MYSIFAFVLPVSDVHTHSILLVRYSLFLFIYLAGGLLACIWAHAAEAMRPATFCLVAPDAVVQRIYLHTYTLSLSNCDTKSDGSHNPHEPSENGCHDPNPVGLWLLDPGDWWRPVTKVSLVTE